MRLRSRLAGPLAAVTLAFGLAGAGLSEPTPVLASNGYVETASTTYTVNPAARRLDVAIDISFENTKRSTPGAQYYYSGVYVWVEHAARHLGATQAGAGGVQARHVKQSGDFDEYDVSFASAVFYGQSRRLRVTYQLPTGAPRSTSDIRVDPAIASFCVVGQGDDGGSTKVVIPSGYSVSVTAGGGGTLALDPASATVGSTTKIWSSGSLAEPYAFWACLSGSNEAGYATSTLTSPGGRVIDLQSWPEDSQWKAEVRGELDGLLPQLETLVGRELPGNGPIVVREVAGNELGNYAGFYNSVTGVIVLGEDLGQRQVVAHELSHAWFNDRTFSATWMSEGMAEWARISTVPDSCPDPGAYPDPGAAPHLADWLYAGPRATTTDLEVVQWQYDAACYVVSSLAAKAGADRWRAVLTALFDDQLAYQAPGLVLTHLRTPVRWQDWLDAVDELGLVPAGVADLDYTQNLLLQFGIVTSPDTLAERSRARARYHQLIHDLGDWTMPEAVLGPMATWNFKSAETALDQVAAIHASIAKADAALPGIDAANGPVRMLFEHAKTVDDLKAAAAVAADQAAAAEAVAAASTRVSAPRDTLMEIGLAGADLAGPMAAATAAAKAGDRAGAQAAVSQVNALLDGASGQGTLRVALAIGLALALLLLLVFVVVRARRGRRKGAAGVPLAAATMAAATTPAAASSITAEPAEVAASEPATPSPPPEIPPGAEP